MSNPLQMTLTESPLQEILHPVFIERGLRLFLKRDDLLHWPGAPAFGGNKWRKLKYNLIAAKEQGYQRLLTFGGAFSNHLAAVAAAAKTWGFASTGMVRGERPEADNPTLAYAAECGMELHFLSRSDYRQATANPGSWAHFAPDSYVLPEGGSNQLAFQGCMELAEEILHQIPLQSSDFIMAACGTGATLAGIAAGCQARCQALGISVVGGHFMADTIAEHLRRWANQDNILRQINEDYTFGGYARFSPALISFINDFKSQYHIPLDPIYTGKLLFAATDLAKKGFFPVGTKVVAVHSGGLQGIAGFNQRFGNLLV